MAGKDIRVCIAHRLRAAIAMAIAVPVVAGCVSIEDQVPGSRASLPATSAPGSAAMPASAAAPAPGSAALAARQLDKLAVANGSSMRGYRRDRFPHWRDTGANCNVRDTVLRRDGERVGPVQLRGCNVVGGRWHSPYDGRTLTGPRTVDVDHVVPLANAWRSGAGTWTDKRRSDFANDLTRPQLKAVSLTSNRAKGDQDPAQWKPPNRAYWCQYALDWIAVKYFWKLTVTTAEKAALEDMIGACR
jgi:hypothetical protein